MVRAKDNFKSIVIKMGYSLRGLSIAAGLSPTTLQKIYKSSLMYPSTAKKICDVTGLCFDDIFEVVVGNKGA